MNNVWISSIWMKSGHSWMNFIHGDVTCDNGKQQGFPRSMGCKALLVWVSLWGKLNIKNDQMQDLH